MQAYEHASFEPGLTRLHANEFPWRAWGDASSSGLQHYPEPQPAALLARLAAVYELAPNCLLLSRGSDEAIDLLVRAFCRAGQDAVLTCPPTFGMYAVAAAIQGAAHVQVPLHGGRFALDTDAVLRACGRAVKVVFLCSPNNPTGNLLEERAVTTLLEALRGRALVVVDEAYIEFAPRRSLAALLPANPHLAVLRTLSKAHGLAGARLGALLAAPELVALLRKLIAPYAIPRTTLEAALEVLQPANLARQQLRISQLCTERNRMREAMATLARVREVHASDANFLLARFHDPAAALQAARQAGFLVRDARSYRGLEDALRVTVGTPAQNARLLGAWQ